MKNTWQDWLVARLTRVTSSGRFVAELDGLRFVAIMWVVVFHVWAFLARGGHADEAVASADLLGRFAARGYYGVQLFFVISGFILALPFASHHLQNGRTVGLKQYFVRRLSRLEPPYVINLLVCFVLIRVDDGTSLLSLLPHLLASLIYQHGLIYGEPSTINHIAWSLEIEVQFYVLVPLLTQLFRIRPTVLRRGVITAAAVGVVLTNQLVDTVVAIEGLHLGRYLHLFLMGFLLADIYLVNWQSNLTPRRVWDFWGALGWIGFVAVTQFDGAWVPYVSTALIVPAYMGAMRGVWLKRLFSQPLIAVIGGMCYTIYLYHTLFGAALARLFAAWGEGSPFWLYLSIQCLIHVPVVVVGSTVFFALFERPFMKHRWWRRAMGS